MAPESITRIKEAALDWKFSIDQIDSESFGLVIHKNDLKFKVIVPVNALEWYFEVEDVEGEIKSHDWFDYYDKSSKEELFIEMEKDIIKLVQELSGYDYRLRTTKTYTYCERYEIDDRYQVGSWRAFNGST